MSVNNKLELIALQMRVLARQEKEEKAKLKQNAANSITTTLAVNAKSVELTDVSPLEHSVMVKVGGKNLLDISHFTEDASYITISNNGTRLVFEDTTYGLYTGSYVLEEPIKKGSKITISWGDSDIDATLFLYFATYGNTEGQECWVSPMIEKSLTISARFDIGMIFMKRQNVTVHGYIDKLQIEYGTEATEWVPYAVLGENITVTEEGTGKTATINAEGIAELQSASPSMKITTDAGIIERIEYNRDINSVLEEIAENAADIETANQRIETANKRIETNESLLKSSEEDMKKAFSSITDLDSSLKSLGAMVAKTGNINHRWFSTSNPRTAIPKDVYGVFIAYGNSVKCSYSWQTTDAGGNVTDSGTETRTGVMHVVFKTRNNWGKDSSVYHFSMEDPSSALILASLLSKLKFTSYRNTGEVIFNCEEGSMDVLYMPMKSEQNDTIAKW